MVHYNYASFPSYALPCHYFFDLLMFGANFIHINLLTHPK